MEVSMSLTSNQLFQDIAEKLLIGQIICKTSHESLFEYLDNPDNRSDVDHYLRRIGRMLKTTLDEAGYYAAYRNLDAKSVRTDITRQFNTAINDLEPLVRWLKLTFSANNTGTPLHPGDTLRGSDLLSAIESAPSLIEELSKIARSNVFKSSSSDPKKQLERVTERLCDDGYLVKKGSSGSVFSATAKWSRLYEMLEFVATHEQLDLHEEESTQMEINA